MLSVVRRISNQAQNQMNALFVCAVDLL